MTEIPNAFGGFAPFPNTIMIPTMGLQSDVIGFRFGFGYEKGKRTLRAMSNEQFNNLDEEAEQAIYKHHEATAINHFNIEIQKWTDLQQIIIEKHVEIEVAKATRTPSAMAEVFTALTTATAKLGKDSGLSFAEAWDKLFGGQQIVPSPFPPTTTKSDTPTPTPPAPSPTSRRNPPPTTSTSTPPPTETVKKYMLKYNARNVYNATWYSVTQTETLDGWKSIAHDLLVRSLDKKNDATRRLNYKLWRDSLRNSFYNKHKIPL